jgi:hypothetical protein
MTTAKPNPLLRWMPSLTDLAFLMPLVFIFAKLDGIRTLLGDGDTGWHIRIGEWILAHGRVPRSDIFSFSMPNAPFYAWEWLWDMSFAWLHQHGGLALVVLVSMTLLSLTFALLFRLVLRNCGNRLIAIAVTMLATAASSIHWLARPHLVTFLFVVIFLDRLERVRESETSWRSLAWLPVLMVVWTNLHGGFFVGLLLLACYAAGEALSGLVEGKGIPRKAVWFAWAGVACALATLLNPYFYQLHVHLVRYFTESYHLEAISEFQTMSFHDTMARYFEAMMLLAAVAAFWNLTRKRFYAVFLLIGWIHLALIAGRNIAIFALVAAPLVAEALERFVAALPGRADLAEWLRGAARGFQSYAAEIGEVDVMPRAHVICGLALAVMAAVAYAPAPPAMFRSDYDPKRYPAGAIEHLRGGEFSHSVFTQDEWGDYMIYRMYPATKVFVDGRSDFYGEKFGRKYLDVLNVKYDWERTLLDYGIDTILMPPDAALTGALKESPRWCLVYDDQVALIFRHRMGAFCAASDATSFAAARGEKGVIARSHDSERVVIGETQQ